MFKYHCLNPIADVGLDLFIKFYEKTEEVNEADAILVRSASMHDMELSDNLLAVARAGAGVNNIPLDKCAEKGVVVFNTPGANANGVKELVIAAMLYASRDVIGGIEWCIANKDDENIAKTICSILMEFFSNHENVIIFICDSTDKRERQRNIIFNKWFHHFDIDSLFEKIDSH